MAALTFRDLAVGDRFLFPDDFRRNGSPELPETVIEYRVKTGAHTFAIHYADGETADIGRVGVGDNPVRKVL